MSRFSRIIPSAVIITVGIALSAMGFQITRQQEAVQIQLDLERDVDAYANILQDALGGVERELASVAGLFTATGEVGFEEFRDFVRPALDRTPGTWAVTWVARVPAARKEEFLRAARLEVTSDFEIRERDSNGRIVPAKAREDYFPILYTEAIVAAENIRAWGVDPMTDPTRRVAFTKAMDTGLRSATSPITSLSSSFADPTTVATIQPIFEKGLGIETVQERRAAIKGFVVVLVRVRLLVDSAMAGLRSNGLDFYLYDSASGSEGDFINFQTSPGQAGVTAPATLERLRSGRHVAQELNLADRTWSAIFVPAPGFYVGGDKQALTVLVAGVLLTALLALYQYSILAQNVRVSSQVAKQTKELKQNQENLLTLNGELSLERDRAEAANRAKSEFLAAMSHELRTPLNAVIGFSEMIGRQTFGPVGDDRYREYAGDIHGAGIHLLDLINDVLDLAKVEAGSEELHEQDVDIGELQRSVLSLVQGRAAEKEVQLKQEIQENLPLIHADLRKLKQILVNLMDNAIKFNDHGGTVTLKVWRSKDGFVFQVIDTGIGMTDADIPKALSRFGQVDGGFNRCHNGTGLGLPLTKALVELHGGSLDLQSRPKIGTTVTARFPSVRTIEG